MEAVKWYHKSVEQGNSGAQCNLDVCYENGTGVEWDVVEVVKWLCKSTEQGNNDAQCSLV